MCFGIFKLFKHLNTVSAKSIVVIFFLLTFNFLDFFEICRGYGLSFGFMLLGLSYLLDYFSTKQFSKIVLFSLCWQLALAANLILVVVLTILFFYIFVFQIRNKLFFDIRNVILQVINLIILVFWIKFSFFYKEQGKLDYGVGNNYWNVTFKTLIQFLYSTSWLWIQVISIICIFFLLVCSLAYFIKRPFSIFKVYDKKIFFCVILFTCALAFFLQKIVLNVNYPEDRTGLFFYLFFVLGLAFIIDQSSKLIATLFTGLLFVLSCFHFITTINFKDFTSLYYHTMPKALYDQLMDEYKKTNQIFTIGGHRVREMNYAFMNYRGGAILNHMDDAEQMTMNCDYYYAMKREKPYYQFFYDEIGEDKTWDRVLLKRKEKIGKNGLVSITTAKNYKGNNEYFEFIQFGDTTAKSGNCLEAELSIDFKLVPKPFNAFLVFSIDNAENKNVYFKRVPLNWLADNLNGSIKYFRLTTGRVPAKGLVAKVFIWNIDKQDVDFSLNYLKIYELKGKGVNFTIPATFYPLIETITKQPLL